MGAHVTALQWHNIMVITGALLAWFATLALTAYVGVWMFELIERVIKRG